MTRSVADSAIVLSIIAGKDPNDNFTLAQPSPVPDYTKALNKNALRGARIGVPRRVFLNDTITGNDPFVNQVFEQAIKTIRSLGATIVDPADLPSADEMVKSDNETIVLNTDFKVSHLKSTYYSVRRSEKTLGPIERLFRSTCREPHRCQDARRPYKTQRR